MKLQEKLQICSETKSALLACNFYNFETLKGICLAAYTYHLPVILQLSRSSIEYMGLETAVKLGRAAIDHYQIEAWIHLDHGDSIELAHNCLLAGFDSVMIDASEKSFEENVEITRKVVNLARRFDGHVEAELGYVPKLGQSHDELGFTEPSDALKFIEATDVNALAVAIGSAHGFYKKEPELDLGRLANIRELTMTPLVLHGGSGIPGNILRKAIEKGICKINIATDIKDVFMRTLAGIVKDTQEIDLRILFPPAIDAVKELVCGKMDIVYF